MEFCSEHGRLASQELDGERNTVLSKNSRGLEWSSMSLPRILIPVAEGSCSCHIGVDECVNVGVNYIVSEISNGSNESWVKAPVQLIRCAGGGKTTILREIHNRLLATTDCVPLSISFNSNHGFKRLFDESDLEVLFRLVVNELTSLNGNEARRELEWDALDTMIGVTKFVLLIDDIDSLSGKLRYDVATKLKRLFLDKRNRFLVLASRIPVYLDTAGGAVPKGVWADRNSPAVSNHGVMLLKLPSSNDVQLLAGFSCGSF